MADSGEKGAVGAPIDAGTAPGRSAVNGEHYGALQRLRRPRETADDGEVRRRSSGEVGSSTWCTGIQTSSTRRLLTSRRCYGAAPRNPGGGDGVVPHGGAAQVSGSVGTLGFGDGGSRG
jgi:hypothetical protein